MTVNVETMNVEEQLSRKVLPGVPGADCGDDNDHVELVFGDSEPLGIVVIHHGDGKTLKVSEFLADSQAIDVCKAAQEDPIKFVGAFIVGINGKDRGSCERKEFYAELKDPSRPKTIKFQLRSANSHVSHGRAVVAEKDETLVELVFRESRPLGIKISKHKNGDLSVCEFPKNSQAEAVANERDIYPGEFIDAEVVGVNGRRYQDGEDLYEALKTPARPKAVLFRLFQKKPKQSSRRDLLQKARIATESMRQLSISEEEMEKMNAEVTDFQERSKSVTTESPSGTPRAILQRIRKSVTSTNIEDPVTPPSRPRPTFDSESMRKLSSSLEEMEKMNAQVIGFQEKSNSSMSETSPTGAPRSILRGIRNNMASFGYDGDSPTSRPREIIQGIRNMRVTIRSRSTDNVSPESQTEARSNSSSIDYGIDDRPMELVKQEAMEACRKAIRDHLTMFVEDRPDVSYEEWIEELHPENAKSRRNVVKGKSIDHRFYVEQSDHRVLWNSSLKGSKREFVPIREYNPVDDDEEDVPNEKPKQYARSPPTANKPIRSVDPEKISNGNLGKVELSPSPATDHGEVPDSEVKVSGEYPSTEKQPEVENKSIEGRDEITNGTRNEPGDEKLHDEASAKKQVDERSPVDDTGDVEGEQFAQSPESVTSKQATEQQGEPTCAKDPLTTETVREHDPIDEKEQVGEGKSEEATQE